MSQLRKSASFRSRIPVRRNRIARRRCCSPQAIFGEPECKKCTCGCNPHNKLITNRSIEGGPHRSKSHHHFNVHRHTTRHNKIRCYSSSSFSSSDESCESEAPHQKKFVKQTQRCHNERSMYVSTDAISLDGLLDSVSCGSFSSPPSPILYANTQELKDIRNCSYESLDKYNCALKSFHITDFNHLVAYPLALNFVRSPESSSLNINNKNNYNFNNKAGHQYKSVKFTSVASPIMTSREKQQPSTTKKSTADIRDASKDEASKNSFYIEKQKQLSDWYYIKTKKDVVIAEESHDDMLSTRKKTNDEKNDLNEVVTINDGENLATRNAQSDDSLRTELNYVNCSKQVHSTSAIKPNQPTSVSLNQKTTMGNARYADATPQTIPLQSNEQRQQTQIKWNNFDDMNQLKVCYLTEGVLDNQVRNYNVLDTHNDMEVEYKEAIDAIKNSEFKLSSSTTTSQNKPICPPYYCPPTYANHKNYSNEHPQLQISASSADNADLSNVNVRLLKQHYQQRNNQAHHAIHTAKMSTEYANVSFRRRVEFGKRNKNKVEIQLEHWENIGNNKSGSDVTAKYQPTMTDSNRNQNSVRSTPQNSTGETHPLTAHQHQQQHLQQHQFHCSDCCINNANTTEVHATNTYKNIRPGSSSDNTNKQNNNRSNILHRRHYQQQEQPLYENPVTNSPAAQQHHHPAKTNEPTQSSPSGMQQQQQKQHHQQLHQPPIQQKTKQQANDQDSCSTTQPAAAPRHFPYPPTATPRAALRSRLIQKRSDETSCSSFEQLNIVGIPTGDDVSHMENNAFGLAVDSDVVTLAYATQEGSRYQNQAFDDHCYADNVSDKHEDNALQATEDQPKVTGLLEIFEEQEQPTSKVTKHYLEQRHQLEGEDILNRELPDIPDIPQSQKQLILQQNLQTRQLLGALEPEMFPPKATPSCRSECELSGSYASLECPSPPGPPVSLPESRRDPQARLGTYMRSFYTDLALKEPIIPQWAIPVAPGALCAARLEPDLRLNPNSHGFCDSLTIDQILVSLQTKEGTFLESPRRCLIECPAWVSRSNLCLRILHAWAKEPPWPTKGTPVALALFIPLAEVKRSFANYIEKELIAKGPSNPFLNCNGGFSAAWSSLEALGPKLLFILDGYDSQKLGNPANSGGTPKKSKSHANIVGGGSKHHYPTDVHDLLDGKIFPESRVIITTSTTNCPELLPIIQRHLTFEGLTWGRSASLLGGGQWGGPSRLLDAIQENIHLRKVVRTPLGCLAVTAIYETTGGNLPTDEMDVVESVLNCVAPETTATNVSELGRLALFCLKMKRPCFTIAEFRMYCSTPESSILGCLDKNLLLGRSAKKKSEYVYYPICAGMMELLAANYIASLASRPGLLAAEITGMAVGDELDPDLLKVLKFAMTLLGSRAHILLSRLTPLWLTPQIVFTLALAGGHAEDNLAALCDILGISKHPPISPLETKPLWVQVRSIPTDLMGWGMALKSPTCTLKNLEVIYQLEKHNPLESRKAIEVFLDSIIANESVSTLRLSSLIEMDVKDSEISYLANFVSRILLKPRLENFELVLTLLEEDPPILKLQSVVAALCRTIPRQPKLSFLLLDLTLSTSQIVQLCATLEKYPNVTRLSLPHLRCERGAITALASLLNSRPISFLSLPSCWGARDDPPSSSGVSMGSGSGSSTGTSGLIKQGSLPGVPSPRSYAPGIFSSLPRGVFVPQSSLGRSATLPRQPLEQSLDKRSCDSVVSKTWYPTPACDGGPHNSGTLHDLLLAARDSYSKLHGLDLSKAQLSLEDSMCLGETVRLSNTLHTLKLEGSSRLSEVLPSVLGASESSCLQMLSIGSPRLSLEDSAIAMCARALTSCSTLRLLSLDGWSFRIENSSTLSILRAFLSLTSIRELSLANCRLQIGLIKSDTKIAHAFESRSVVVLKLAGAQATLADANIMRGPQLLQYIGGFPCLRELDLSAPARSGMGSTHTTPLILDDKCIINFFQNLHSYFGLLNTLKICHWVIHFDDLSKTLKTISKCIRNSPISHLKMDGISVLDRPKKQRSEVNLIHCFISSLPLIRWMGISLAGKKEDQITAIGNAVLDLKGFEIDIKLSESTIEHAKLMAQAISLDGKFDIKVSTFGTSSGILVHAEKSGAKSLTRKTKE